MVGTTVDRRNPAPVDMVNICKYPMIYSGLYISGGCLGFLPPTVFSGDYADYVRFLTGKWLKC